MRYLIVLSIILFANVAPDESHCANYFEELNGNQSRDQSFLRHCVGQLDDSELTTILENLLTDGNEVAAIKIVAELPDQRPTPPLLHRASRYDQDGMVETLLARDPVLINEKGESGYAAIVTAAVASAKNVATILLENGATEDLGEALAISSGRDVEIARMIIDRDPTLLVDAKSASRVLSEAGRSQDVNFVEYLVDHGADAKSLDKFGHSVAFSAAHNPDEESGSAIWSFLIANGADVKQEICKFDEETIGQVDANMPEWFAEEVVTIRSSCQ